MVNHATDDIILLYKNRRDGGHPSKNVLVFLKLSMPQRSLDRNTFGRFVSRESFCGLDVLLDRFKHFGRLI